MKTHCDYALLDEQGRLFIYTRDTYKWCSSLDDNSEVMAGISVK
jgi:hypothetical protein